MESSVRTIICSVLIYQSVMAMINCEVIGNQVNENHEATFEQPNGASNLTLSEPQVKSNETSINYTNATSTTSRGFDINVLTHMMTSERSLLKVHSLFHSVKRSFKKALFAWTYYGPEFGLCSCIFKFAWHEYPIVPEMTHAVMGRASRMVNNFMHDFMEGWREDRSKSQYRVSNKVADTTGDDYFEYQTLQAPSPSRRVSGIVGNFPEQAPLFQKADPKLTKVVDMLKNLQPKAKANATSVKNFIIRIRRNMKFHADKSNSYQQSRTREPSSDANQYLLKQHQPEYSTKVKALNAVNASVSKLKDNKTTTLGERRSLPVNTLPTHFVPPPQSQRVLKLFNNPSNPIRSFKEDPVTKTAHETDQIEKRIFHGVPNGLPTFNDLPPADYSYVKHGVHHHVHDLRKNKAPYPVKGGGWLSIDFEDAILSALGLTHPGRSVKHTATKCGKIYIFQVVLRFIQTALVG